MNRTKNLTFIIGGAYGFSSELKEKFKLKIALSKLTFSHDMARLFFTEQLYRSLTIINKIPYHNR
jgi:23S rRNA (pseudouridine1915-N3)-methyltransferase